MSKKGRKQRKESERKERSMGKRKHTVKNPKKQRERKMQLPTFTDAGFLKHVFQKVVDLLEGGSIFGIPLPTCNHTQHPSPPLFP